MTRVITVSSGKGGVGKTLISVNLAVEAARRGLKVCLFDADLGLANISILLNLYPDRTLVDVVEGRCQLRDILIRTPYGLDVIPGSSGVDVMANLDPEQLTILRAQFRALEQYDLVLIDTSSGVGRGVMSIIKASPMMLLVITPEPTSMTDAYGLMKLLHQVDYDGDLRVIVNCARTMTQANQTFARFSEVVRVYLQRSLALLGWIPHDHRVCETIRQQKPLVLSQPDVAVARHIAALLDSLLEDVPATGQDIDTFWSRYVQQAPAQIRTPAAKATPAATGASAAARVQAPADVMQRMAEKLDQLSDQVHELRQQMQGSPLSRDTRASAGPARFSDRHADMPAMPEGVIAFEKAEGHSGIVRSGRRPTPIDAVQLRRIVGRLILKAIGKHAAPLDILTESVAVPGDNKMHLRAGRYSCITIAIEDVEQPQKFVEEVFENCDIVGCDVRHLGSDAHCWLVNDRDGCISLESLGRQGARLQIYLPAGESDGQYYIDEALATGVPHGTEDAEPVPGEAPEPARVQREPAPLSAWQSVVERHGTSMVREDQLSDADMDVYRFKRYGKSPLFCGVLRESNGSRQGGDKADDSASSLGV